MLHQLGWNAINKMCITCALLSQRFALPFKHLLYVQGTSWIQFQTTVVPSRVDLPPLGVYSTFLGAFHSLRTSGFVTQ